MYYAKKKKRPVVNNNNNPPGWERSCISCSSTNLVVVSSGRQRRGGGWHGECAGWSCCRPPTHCHLQTFKQHELTEEVLSKPVEASRWFDFAWISSISAIFLRLQSKLSQIKLWPCSAPSQNSSTTAKHQEMRLTSFPELGIAVVTHFGHPVFEVLQWVSVPGTSTAHHLPPKTGKKQKPQSVTGLSFC